MIHFLISAGLAYLGLMFSIVILWFLIWLVLLPLQGIVYLIVKILDWKS